MSAPSHHLAAVWFADLVGYSALSETNEGEALRAVERFQATVRTVVEPHGGRVVKFLGDGALAEFPSTEQAVRSADALRAEFGRVAEAEGLGAREIRIGVHVGDVAEREDGDLYGDGVNVASRIQAAADPGEVWVSEDVRRQLRQRPELRFASRGRHALKGLRTKIELHAVGIGESAPEERPSATAPRVEAQQEGDVPRAPGGIWGRRRALSLLGAGILVALVAIGASTWFLGRGSDGVGSETVLAVLPFENLSGDEATEPFVLGVHDDLVTQLSRIGRFRVISRTSVMSYLSSDKSAPEIAQELGATTVLEGGVQRAGDRIRMNVQLIDARTDEHLWAERYDRTLTAEDVFAIQAEIAERIAAALATALTPQEKAELAAVPTRSLEALDHYYQGLAYYRGRNASNAGNQRRAASALASAVEADPQFAAGWAMLAQARASLVFFGFETDTIRAREALDRAIQLAPDSPETALSEGVYLYTAKADFVAADDRLKKALSRWPNDAELLSLRGLVVRRLGRWVEAVEYGRRALDLDPRSAEVLSNLGTTLADLRRYDEAEEMFDKVVELWPGAAADFARHQEVKLLLYGKGDTLRTRLLLEASADAMAPVAQAVLEAQLAFFTRDFEAGAATLEGKPVSPDSREVPYWLALLSREGDHQADVRKWADSLAAFAQRMIEELDAASYDPLDYQAEYVAYRGIAHALSGRNTEALRDARRARGSLPISKDAVHAPNVHLIVARIHILVGDLDTAFDVLDSLASVPSKFAAASLRLDPGYDPLRDDPRYAALVRKLEAAERSGSGTL